MKKRMDMEWHLEVDVVRKTWLFLPLTCSTRLERGRSGTGDKMFSFRGYGIRTKLWPEETAQLEA